MLIFVGFINWFFSVLFPSLVIALSNTATYKGDGEIIIGIALKRKSDMCFFSNQSEESDKEKKQRISKKKKQTRLRSIHLQGAMEKSSKIAIAIWENGHYNTSKIISHVGCTNIFFAN